MSDHAAPDPVRTVATLRLPDAVGKALDRLVAGAVSCAADDQDTPYLLGLGDAAIEAIALAGASAAASEATLAEIRALAERWKRVAHVASPLHELLAILDAPGVPR